MREGRWQTRQAEGLGGKKLGILGMGRLGTMVAGYGNHFDMDVIAWGPTLDAERAAAIDRRAALYGAGRAYLESPGSAESSR